MLIRRNLKNTNIKSTTSHIENQNMTVVFNLIRIANCCCHRFLQYLNDLQSCCLSTEHSNGAINIRKCSWNSDNSFFHRIPNYSFTFFNYTFYQHSIQLIYCKVIAVILILQVNYNTIILLLSDFKAPLSLTCLCYWI